MSLPHYNQSVHLSPSNSKRIHLTGHKARFTNLVQCSLQLDTRSASLTKPYQNSREDKFPQAHNELKPNTQFTKIETCVTFLSVVAAWALSLYFKNREQVRRVLPFHQKKVLRYFNKEPRGSIQNCPKGWKIVEMSQCS
jgi:hypothetical protein